MTSAFSRSVFATLALGLAPQLAAQAAGALAWTSEQAVGLQRVEGELWGAGAAYKAHFAVDGVEITPALGRRAPRNLPIRVSLLSVGRSGEFVPVEPCDPVRVGDHGVEYSRRGWVERYDVRREGLEQSFVFEALPSGDGDLVVRCRVDTELTPAVEGVAVDRLAFLERGLGGIEVGSVTGIGADGRRARGSLHYERGVLELRLPGAFVDRARLPLVLDPLLGPAFDVPGVGLGGDDQLPSVSYESSSDTYLVVWHRWFSASNADIYGQRLDAGGAPVGGVLVIRKTRYISDQARVASVRSRGMFVVAWQEVPTGSSASFILAVTVNSATGAVGPMVIVGNSPDYHIAPDIGGDETSAFAASSAIVVWRNATQDTILAVRLAVSSFGLLSPSSPLVVASSPSSAYEVGSPRIARTNGGSSLGSLSRWLVTWVDRHYGGPRDLQGAVIDNSLSVLDYVTIAASNELHVRGHVDGDGTEWTVGYSTEEPGIAGDRDARCRRVVYDPTTHIASVGAETVLKGLSNDDENVTGVTALSESTLVGLADESPVTSGNGDAFVVSLDPATCVPCEGTFLLQNGSLLDMNWIQAARRRAGTGDDALIVWEAFDRVSFTGSIRARLFRAADGSVRTVSTGCGRGGTAIAACALRGHPKFTFRLREAAALSPALLVLSAAVVPGSGLVYCPGCVLVADPSAAVVVPVGATDRMGNASLAVALPANPALAGLVLWAQWGVVPPAPSCKLLDVSSAVSVTVE